LKCIGQARFHALSASDAGSQKFRFRNCPGGADKLEFALPEGERSPRRQKPNSQSPSQGIDEPSARKIYSRIFSAYGKGNRKSDGVLRTDFNAGPALDAFWEMTRFWILRNRPHGTGLPAFQTFIALLADLPFEKAQWRNQTEESSQRTKIAAPEARSDKVESNDPSEDEERDGGHIKYGLKKMQVREGYPSKGFG
jgi:hypothetical protein